MISWKNTKDKQEHEKIVNYYSEIIKGLGIDLSKPFNLEHIELTNDMSDISILNDRLLLLSRIAYYLGIIQGQALELQREYKHSSLYGLYESVSEITRAVRMESDILRTILSTAREQIKMK
jgi:hypothetical protein